MNGKKVIMIRSTSIINDSRLLKQMKVLCENNYKVKVLGWDRQGLLEYENINNIDNEIECFFLKSDYGLGYKGAFKIILFQIWLFIKLIQYNKEYKIIHCCDLDTAIPAKIVSKIYKKKIVYDIFDYYSHSHPIPLNMYRLVEAIENKIINSADLTIICNEGRRKQILNARPKKCIVIHNTPEITSEITSKISRGIGCDKKLLKIVYVGVLQEHRLLREVLEKIEGNKCFELHIGGFGILEEVVKSYAERNENIFFYGSMKYEDVLKLEEQCDILFATYDPKIENHKYSAPNKLYEAMGLGKPIIVCKKTGIDQIVDKHGIGISIEYDAREFLEALIQLGNHEELRYNMATRGKELYKNEYSWEQMKKRLVQEYDKVI